jgi:hypothetical protein
MSDAVTAPTVLTPHALPMYRDLDPGRGSKRKRDKERQDPRKSRRPELPVTGPGRGGRVGASATQHIVQNLVRDTTRNVDVSRRSIGPHMLTEFWIVSSHEKHCSNMRMLQKGIRNGLLVSYWSPGNGTAQREHVLLPFLFWCIYISDVAVSQLGKSTSPSPCLRRRQKRRKRSSRPACVGTGLIGREDGRCGDGLRRICCRWPMRGKSEP